MKVGDSVIVHDQFDGLIRKMFSNNTVAVAYLRHGVSFLERVPVVKVKPRPPNPPLAPQSI